MKRTFNLLLLLYLFFIGGRVTGQEFENIVPLSPNAAAIAKYGEVPINHFSGVPNIGLPIYTIASGSLELPLALSYHAGGNKVETISSWVGLGWSLTSIPSISRSVRGIPDDGSGGYFKKIAGKTVKEYWYSQYDESKVTFDTFRQRLRLGEADSEPDIFQYNIPGESGKFIYNQENEQFVTIPKSNTRISWDGYNFTIVDENGVQYFFNVKEKNTGQSSNNNSSSVVTSWCATRILAANQVDEIVLEYYPYAEERYKTITSVTKYQYIEGPTNGVSFKDPAGSVVTNNIVEVKPIKRIDFAGGYVLFNISEAERDDLNGGHSLDNIEVYTSLDQIVKRYKFEYGYLTGSGDIYEDKANKWMILNSFENQYLDQPSGLTHHFYYNTSNIPSSRNSAAQDNWGYYNGAEQNSNLIPSISIKTEDQRIIQVEGANRQINATKSQFGILKKITYPTGGYTEFDFENNEVIAGVVEPEYENDYVSCSADDFLNFEETLKIKNSFESEVFTIDFPPDMKINGNHEEGGAFISFEIDHLGCELNGHSGPCADLRIVNVATNQSYFINMNTTFHVLNGEYKLTASFEQDPPNYQNYVFIANWFKFKEQSKYYAGGLRVKEIRTYPTGDSNENPLIKRYKYVSDFESEESSGDVFSKPNFVYSDFVTYVAQYDDGNVSEYGRSAIYLRMKSYPNTQQISHSGSFVGYKNVIEETSSLEEQGCTVYKYSHARDLVSQEFPYPPAKSKELQRGKLLEKIDFKFEDGCYVPVRKKIFKYMYGFYEPEGEMEPLYSLGVKWGNIHFGSSSETNYAQYLKRYDLNFDFSKLSKEINIDYIGSDSIFQTTDYDYDIRYLHLKSSDFSDSQGKNTKTHYKYPLDYNPIENFSTLIDNNIIGRPIDIRTYKDNVLISGEQKKYNNLGELTDLYKFESSAQDISFKENDAYTYSHKLSASYYSFGKIKSVHPDNNIVSYYVWAYDHKYPVVEIKSSNESLNVEQIQVAVDAINLSRSQNQSLILSDINNLKVAVQAYLSDADFANYYTYSPLLGMTSKIDVNGVCTFYEFDTFGRLRVVKDDDNKIINEYLYHYVGDKPYTGGLRSYTVSVTQPDNGSISPGNLVLEPNETKQVQIFPDANYQVKNVIVNDVSQGAISSLTLFGDKDYTISAEMKLVSYQITSTSGYGGTISTGGAVNHGSNKTFTITPSTGYHITNVKVDGVSQGAISSYVFSNVTASHTIHVDFAINTYSISSTKSSGGSITGSATLNYGSNKTFTITPSTGYHITNVKVDGVSQGAISSYTFSNVTASHTIHADFAINTYSISSTKSSGGSITGSATLNYGSNKTFTITPSTGYHITNVKVDGVSQGAISSYAFSNVTASHTIHVDFAINTYSISSTKSSGGSITGSATLNYGSNKTFTITPSTGYHITNVKVDGVSQGAISSYAFSNVTASHTIHADFAINTYSISSTKSSGGSITGSATLNYGSNKTFTITPSTGYYITNVKVDGVSQGAISSYVFSNVTASHTIHADFAINTYSISSTKSSGGSITGSATLNYGSNKTFTITPSTGYHITNVKVDGVSKGAITSYTFSNVTANHTIHADFAINTYSLSSSKNSSGGSITASAVVNYGSSKIFSITPSTGYHITNVKVDGVSKGAITSYTFSNVTANHSIHADFAINTYLLASSSGSGGSITSSTSVNHGSSKTFTITPSNGYHITNIKVDGVSKGAIGSYTFSNVTTAHIIHADFAINTYAITSTRSVGGSITSSASVIHGGSKTFSITPSSGYDISNVKVDGVSKGIISSYTFSNVTSAHSIHVDFVLRTLDYSISSWDFPYNTSLSKTISVNSNVSWSLSESLSWISLSKTSGSGSSSVVIYCTENTSTSSRSGTITLSGGGIIRTFTVSQEKKQVSLSVSETTVYMDNGGNPIPTVYVTCNHTWSVSDNASWITFSPSSGSGNGRFYIYGDYNGSNQNRSGQVTVVSGGISRTITVIQHGKPDDGSGDGGPVEWEEEGF